MGLCGALDQWSANSIHRSENHQPVNVPEAYSPSSQRYAISLRSDFNGAGVYQWWYPDGSTTFPQFYMWAAGHPRDEPCVSMDMPSGQWRDGACLQDSNLFAICEKQMPTTTTRTTTTTTTTTAPATTTEDESTTNGGGDGDWTDVCSYVDQSGDTCCSEGMETQEYLARGNLDDWEAHSLECK